MACSKDLSNRASVPISWWNFFTKVAEACCCSALAVLHGQSRSNSSPCWRSFLLKFSCSNRQIFRAVRSSGSGPLAKDSRFAAMSPHAKLQGWLSAAEKTRV